MPRPRKTVVVVDRLTVRIEASAHLSEPLLFELLDQIDSTEFARKLQRAANQILMQGRWDKLGACRAVVTH